MSCHTPKRKRNKVIIFDSPDGTGKTNIAQALSLHLNIPYFRMATQHENWRQGKFKEALEFDQTYISQFLLQTRYSVIIDRAYPSEWVYSSVYGRPTNEEVLREVDETFYRLGAYIVIPVRHDYTNNRKDEVIADDMLPKIHDKYMEFRRWTRCSTITLYVDAFENNTIREIEALKPELNFESDVQSTSNITLDREVSEKDLLATFQKSMRSW